MGLNVSFRYLHVSDLRGQVSKKFAASVQLVSKGLIMCLDLSDLCGCGSFLIESSGEFLQQLVYVAKMGLSNGVLAKENSMVFQSSLRRAKC